MIPLHKRMESGMKMFTPEEVLHDLATLPQDYKTADVDRLIKGYIAVNADVSLLREYILTRQELHRIYFFVSLKQMSSAEERMVFIHGNLLLSDWWHTDQLIGFVADLSFDAALAYAKEYMHLDEAEGLVWGTIRTAMSTVSDICIVPMQDYLDLDGEARMNFPGTMTDCNWTWRAKDGIINPALAEKVGALTKLYCRIGIQK